MKKNIAHQTLSSFFLFDLSITGQSALSLVTPLNLDILFCIKKSSSYYKKNGKLHFVAIKRAALV